MAWRIIVAAAVVILVAAVAYRFYRIRHYPVGVGYNLPSPDRQLKVYATTFYDVSFFGARSGFYRFEIEDLQTHQTVARYDTSSLAESALSDLGSEAHIEWRADSRGVTITAHEKVLWQYHVAI